MIFISWDCQFSKPCGSGIPSSVKSNITEKCVEFVCNDIRLFKTVSRDGFIALVQSLINVGVQCGQVSAKEVLLHPITVSRRLSVSGIKGTGPLLQKVRKDEATAYVIKTRGQHTLKYNVRLVGLGSEEL